MSAGSFSPLSEQDTTTLEDCLNHLKERLSEVMPGEKLEFDDRAFKPLQRLLSKSIDDRLIQAVELGLGEVFKREFDLDWVSVESPDGDGTRIGLNIPCTPNVLMPSEFFGGDLRAGKPVNLRVAYLEWATWIEEHALD